jgi:hypothetical protein
MIKTTIQADITHEQLLTLLNENGFTGLKPSYDENGQPIYDIQYQKDENDEFVLTGEGHQIEVSRTQVMETMQPEEYLSYLVKEVCIMPLIRQTTASLQEKRGSLAYPAKPMSEIFSSKITIESIEE